MIFNEWTSLEEHHPPYGKPVLLLVEDDNLKNFSDPQQASGGHRVHTDHF